VADSSYERDSGEKLTGYARVGVPQYIIINLRNRTAEIYSRPNTVAGVYPPAQIISESELLLLRVGEEEFFTVPLGEVLP
jgi:Uma2 family endonuclease